MDLAYRGLAVIFLAVMSPYGFRWDTRNDRPEACATHGGMREVEAGRRVEAVVKAVEGRRCSKTLARGLKTNGDLRASGLAGEGRVSGGV